MHFSECILETTGLINNDIDCRPKEQGIATSKSFSKD